jgi:hypothetical protein
MQAIKLSTTSRYRAKSFCGQEENSTFIVRFKDDLKPGDNMLLDVFVKDKQVFCELII